MSMFCDWEAISFRKSKSSTVKTSGRAEKTGPSDELDALGLEQRAVVLLGESQRRRRRGHVDATGELGLTDLLQPVDSIPVSCRQKMLCHRSHRLQRPVIELRRRVGVDEADHGLEDVLWNLQLHGSTSPTSTGSYR
ncbi:hypothetical protein U9M48_026659 [Paspalum notatum var. saurae]|uniref:Uncharacterized protein n=1 Tax=Paspalum notatum var. saurae TaxID=547442 RepID=A0AAQ3WZE5_PASNO